MSGLPTTASNLSAALVRSTIWPWPPSRRVGLTAAEIGIAGKLLWDRDGQVDLERGEVDECRVRDEKRPRAVLHGMDRGLSAVAPAATVTVAPVATATATVTAISNLLDSSLSPVGRCRSLHQCSAVPRGSQSEFRSSRTRPGCTPTD